MVPERTLVERFSAELDTLLARHGRIGVAVSGGPDSLALLLLAAAARPGKVEAATIDHGLRAEAHEEAATVADLCRKLGVPHAILTARWSEIPETAIQERARHQRYRLLGYWAEERGLDAIATAHHAEDQAETLLMRLARGSGVKGLAGMRPRSVSPGAHVRLVRPLLGWRRTELEQVCSAASVTPAADPSNQDERFERVRVRRALAGLEWLDAGVVAQSAANLADADAALDWAAKAEWTHCVHEKRGRIVYRPTGAPTEIVRRIVARAIRKLATEGDSEPRGAELSRVISTLAEGDTATLRGVLCRGGEEWHFVPSPNRTRPVDNLE
ncbi:MAG: tRNA lysidine(34) synthetase TilS [Sphingomicrobium sp.]